MLTVTTLGDSGPGTLRATVGNALPGDTINFSAILDGQTITLTSGEIPVPEGVSIDGPGQDQLTIDATGSSRIFEIVAPPSGDSGLATTVLGLVLEDGSAGSGAAIDANSYSLTVSNCDFANNVANQGGAISSNGMLGVSGCTFFDNRAVGLPFVNTGPQGTPTLGGAIWCGSDWMELENNNFFINRVVGGASTDGVLGGNGLGGAVAWQGGDGEYVAGTVVISGNAFDYNSTRGGNGSGNGGDALGGAVFVDSPVLDYPTGVFVQVANNTFNRNTATGGNGAIGWEGASGLGGSLQIGNPDSVNQPVSPTFFVIGNQFTRGGAYGGVGGSAYGGAVGFAANLMDETDFAFDENTVSGAVGKVARGAGCLRRRRLPRCRKLLRHGLQRRDGHDFR